MDDVTKPKHYRIFGEYIQTEALDVMRSTLTTAEYIGYLKGNILKYKLRAGDKGSDEDALKDIAKGREYKRALNAYLREISVGMVPDDDDDEVQTC